MSVQYPRGSGRIAQPPASQKTVSACEHKNVSACEHDFELIPAPDEKQAKQNRNREAAEQIRFMDQVRDCLDQYGNALPSRPGADLIASIRNENSSGVKGIGLLGWKMGVKAGMPDIGVFVPRWQDGQHFAGLFIEMKRQDGVASDVSDKQEQVHQALFAAGYRVAVCYGWRRAWAVTCEYLGWRD